MSSGLEEFDETIKRAWVELTMEAVSGNWSRDHHLESAVAAFADVGKLLEAKRIVHALLDPEEGS